MSNYGIATDSLPIFLGNECVIEHFKTLRLKYRDIQRDNAYHIDGATNTVKEKEDALMNKGWVDITDNKIALENLFVFIGLQSLEHNHSPLPLKLIKFRHYSGKTQARIAVEVNQYMNMESNFQGLDNYVEIFIYKRLTTISPNTGYGIHIYDSVGNLKYKDGLNLLMNIRNLPIYFNQVSVNNRKIQPFDENKNPQLKNVGRDIAVLQTAHCFLTDCHKTGQHWDYGAFIYTAMLTPQGDISIDGCESFGIFGAKKHTYPSYATGGAYRDAIICTDRVLIINKPA